MIRLAGQTFRAGSGKFQGGGKELRIELADPVNQAVRYAGEKKASRIIKSRAPVMHPYRGNYVQCVKLYVKLVTCQEQFH